MTLRLAETLHFLNLFCNAALVLAEVDCWQAVFLRVCPTLPFEQRGCHLSHRCMPSSSATSRTENYTDVALTESVTPGGSSQSAVNMLFFGRQCHFLSTTSMAMVANLSCPCMAFGHAAISRLPKMW